MGPRLRISPPRVRRQRTLPLRCRAARMPAQLPPTANQPARQDCRWRGCPPEIQPAQPPCQPRASVRQRESAPIPRHARWPRRRSRPVAGPPKSMAHQTDGVLAWTKRRHAPTGMRMDSRQWTALPRGCRTRRRERQPTPRPIRRRQQHLRQEPRPAHRPDR